LSRTLVVTVGSLEAQRLRVMRFHILNASRRVKAVREGRRQTGQTQPRSGVNKMAPRVNCFQQELYGFGWCRAVDRVGFGKGRFSGM
jgi:hypothetical protein